MACQPAATGSVPPDERSTHPKLSAHQPTSFVPRRCASRLPPKPPPAMQPAPAHLEAEPLQSIDGGILLSQPGGIAPLLAALLRLLPRRQRRHARRLCSLQRRRHRGTGVARQAWEAQGCRGAGTGGGAAAAAARRGRQRVCRLARVRCHSDRSRGGRAIAQCHRLLRLLRLLRLRACCGFAAGQHGVCQVVCKDAQLICNVQQFLARGHSAILQQWEGKRKASVVGVAWQASREHPVRRALSGICRPAYHTTAANCWRGGMVRKAADPANCSPTEPKASAGNVSCHGQPPH